MRKQGHLDHAYCPFTFSLFRLNKCTDLTIIVRDLSPREIPSCCSCSLSLKKIIFKFKCPESEFNEFEPRPKSAINRFQLSAA